MSEELHPLKRLAESILYIFTLPEREAYIDDYHGYITKDESEIRIFVCNVGLNLLLQIVAISFVTIHYCIFHEIIGPQKNQKFHLSMYFYTKSKAVKPNENNFRCRG